MASTPVSRLLLGLIYLSSAVLAVPLVPKNASVHDKTYDYIIVGGGLSGLVVANRLTEDKNGTFVCQVATPSGSTHGTLSIILTYSSLCTGGRERCGR
jgi:hypothetical protein